MERRKSRERSTVSCIVRERERERDGEVSWRRKRRRRMRRTGLYRSWRSAL